MSFPCYHHFQWPRQFYQRWICQLTDHRDRCPATSSSKQSPCRLTSHQAPPHAGCVGNCTSTLDSVLLNGNRRSEKNQNGPLTSGYSTFPSMREFCTDSVPVYMYGKDGKYVLKTMGEVRAFLFLFFFGPSCLPLRFALRQVALSRRIWAYGTRKTGLLWRVWIMTDL